jgi:hypothetical protein
VEFRNKWKKSLHLQLSLTKTLNLQIQQSTPPRFVSRNPNNQCCYPVKAPGVIVTHKSKRSLLSFRGLCFVEGCVQSDPFFSSWGTLRLRILSPRHSFNGTSTIFASSTGPLTVGLLGFLDLFLTLASIEKGKSRSSTS